MKKRTIVVFSIFVISFKLFPQNSDTSSESVTQNSNVLALSQTQSNPVMDERTQIVGKRYMEYRQWFHENVYPLAQEAEKKDIQATQEEIAAQQKAFNAMFPGIPNNPNNLRSEILARKYSKTLHGTSLSNGNIQYAYAQLQSEFSNEPIPQLVDVQPMLEMRALMENRSVQMEVEKCTEQLNNNQNESIIKASETWSITDLMIHAADDECLAQYNDNDSCLLSVKKFNHSIAYLEVPKLLSIDTARLWAINTLLRNFYIADKARNELSTGNESILREKQNWIQWEIERRKYQKIGPQVRDEKLLQDAYSTYFNALFSERRFPYYSIIGSSDSLYINSILLAFKSDTQKNTRIGDGTSKNIDHLSGFPWSHSAAVLLPEEFGTVVDTMHVNGISGIIKTSYGFFIVRLDSIRLKPTLQFEDLQNDLAYLATKRKWKNLDSALEAKAYRIYSSNKRLNKKPDTVKVLAVLTPKSNQTPLSLSKKDTVMGKDKKTPKDPLKGLTVLSTQLPNDICDSLLNRFESSKVKKSLVGPIASRFGVWNFKVLDFSHGNGMMPFSTVKRKLIDSMVVSELKFIPDEQWLKPDSTLDEIALAQSYCPARWDAMGNKDNDHSKPPRELARERQAAELNAWFSKISIHLYAIARQ